MNRWTLHACLLLTLAACSKPESHESAPRPAAGPPDASVAPAARGVRVDPRLVDEGRVRTAPVLRKTPVGVVRLPADVVASAEGAAEAGSLLPGRVARFEIREGDRVKRGQVLAWIDAPEAARAVADLVRARSRTETQTRKVTRLEGLVASEAAAQAALDEARLERDLARADLAAARTVVTNLGLAEPPPTSGTGALPQIGAQLPVRSPVDGTVVERGAPLGAYIAPDTHLFRIVSEGRVLVDARLPDGADVPPAGTAASVKPRGTAEPCAARVLGVLPQVDPSTRSRKVRLAPEGSCGGLVGGAQAEVEIEMRATGADTLVVPAAALVDLRTATVVFAGTGAKGTFEVRPVEPGVRVGDDVVIRAGLKDGEQVVVEGTVLLKGELIRAELGGE